jgi:hypothetical protein
MKNFTKMFPAKWYGAATVEHPANCRFIMELHGQIWLAEVLPRFHNDKNGTSNVRAVRAF